MYTYIHIYVYTYIERERDTYSYAKARLAKVRRRGAPASRRADLPKYGLTIISTLL